MRNLVAALALLSACTSGPIVGTWISGLVYPAAACDGVTDDRVAIQTALNSGATEVRISGTCVVGRAGSSSYGVTVPAGVTLAGDPGAVLLQAPGIAPSVRLVEMDGAGATLQMITLDGNAALQTADEHRAGVFARAGVTLRMVTLQNFSGDGASLYTGSGFVLDHVVATGNRRDGVSCVGTADHILITGSTLIGNSVQQLDLEPATCFDVTLRDSVLDGHDGSGALVSSDYVLAIAHGDRFVGDHNAINGPIDIVHSHGVVLERNTSTNTTASSNVLVYEDSDATLLDNVFSATTARSIVQVTGISYPGAQPSATIRGNTLTGNGAAALVYAQGAGVVDVTGNTLNCTTTGLAVAARASLAPPPPADYPFMRIEMRDNAITGCARAIAVSGIGGSARVGQLIASGNSVGAATSVADDGTGALQFALVSELAVTHWPVGALLTAVGPLTIMTRPSP